MAVCGVRVTCLMRAQIMAPFIFTLLEVSALWVKAYSDESRIGAIQLPSKSIARALGYWLGGEYEQTGEQSFNK